MGEVVSLLLAAVRVFGGWEVDLAGLCAAVVACGAAWIALKQFTSLASAYSTTATELALQTTRLEMVEKGRLVPSSGRRRGGPQPRAHALVGVPHR